MLGSNWSQNYWVCTVPKDPCVDYFTTKTYLVV